MRPLWLIALVLCAVPARAGVAVSAEAGAEASVPRISLRTTLSPAPAAGLAATLNPSLNAALSPALAAPAPAPQALPASAIPSRNAEAIAPAALSARPPALAASASEDPGTGPESARLPAAEKGAPSFKTRILGMLRSMADPFGSKPAPEAPPADEAERLDREFKPDALWAEIAPAARAEIEGLRARKLSKAELSAYVKQEADAAIERIKKARGVANIGFHYNLHGGRREDYVGTGIRATMGDIALRYSMHGDTNHKVYFFQSAEHGGHGPLDATHGEHIFIKTRMGYVLNLFDLGHPSLEAARADGRIKNFSSISMDFHGMKGVPYEAYLAPPVEVFSRTAKKIGLRRLSWDEETLATARFLEAAAAAGGDKVPGGKSAPAEALAEGARARSFAAAKAGPKDRIVPQFALVDDAYFYHGTTLDDLAAIVAAYGVMKADVSQFSLRARDSVEYAADRARRLGRKDNPQVLLQFETAVLSPYVSGKQFQAALAMTDRGMPPVHAAYAAAEKPVPLSLMTAASKTTILSWMRANNDHRLAAFEAALR